MRSWKELVQYEWSQKFLHLEKMFQMLIRPNVEFNVYLIYENDESISPEVSFLMSFENLFFNFVNEH